MHHRPSNVIQLPLFERKRRDVPIPDLRSYDRIVVSSSGGKDSQAMLSYVCELAVELEILDRVYVVHADLGAVEWEGTHEVARAQAEHFDVPFHIVSRIGGVASRSGKTYQAGDRYGDLLDYAERRGAWPSPKNRWCTSDFKRGPILSHFTALATGWRRSGGAADRPCRILDCMGLRAEESPSRASKEAFSDRLRTRNRHVDTWLPIHGWLTQDVWDEIERTGAPHHRAYDLGMPRLSCAFCIFAPKAALLLAGRHNPELLKEYTRVEATIGHDFRYGLSLSSVQAELESEPALLPAVGSWTM